MRETGDDDAYSRARRDPEFLAAVQAVYAGRRNVLNALWWLSRPADAAPDGAPPPLDELRDLQRRVFSASGGSLGDPTATRALRALEAELAAEREAIRDAVDAADSGHGPGLESLFPVDLSADLSAAAALPGGATGLERGSPSPENPGSSVGRARARGRLLVVVGLVAAMAVGIVIGTQWMGGRVEASPSVTSSAEPTAAPTNFAKAVAACAQISDVGTIVLNAGSAFTDKRWTEQEWQGALALAARVLQRVDTDDGTALSSRIDKLKNLFPYVGSAPAPGQTFEVTPEASAAYTDVSDACQAAGADIGVAGWTGG